MLTIRKSVLLLILLSSFQSFAQSLPEQWANTFRGRGKCADRISKILSDASGNVYVSGYAGGVRGRPDMFAMKYNSQGDTLWTYYYDGVVNDEDYVYAMALDAIGNVYLTGSATGTGYFDECVTIKLNANGVQQWANRYGTPGTGSSQGNGIVVDDSGNVYVAGWFDDLSGPQDWLVIKYTSSGQIQWSDLMTSPVNTYDYANDIILSPDQKVTVCGTVFETNANGGQNILVKQYTVGGGTSWINTFTNPSFTGSDEAIKIKRASNGDFIVCGKSYNGTGASMDVVAISYSSTGVQQWATVYSDSTTTNDENVFGMTLDNSDNVYVVASNYANNLVYRFNSNGSQAWRKVWSGPLSFGYDVAFDICYDGVNGIYTVGKGIYPGPDYFGNGGIDNMVVVKYNVNGDSLWTYQTSGATRLSIGFAITSLNGKIYAGGFKADTAYVDENLFTVILDTSGSVINEWEYNGEGSSVTRGQIVRTDAQKNVYSAATINRLYNCGYDVVVVKYDPSGVQLWEQYYSTPGWRNDTLTGMEIDASGNLYLSISSDTNATGSGYQPLIVKMSANGSILDTAWYSSGTTGISFASSMSLRSDGSIVLGGTASVIGGFVIYFDDQLNCQWTAKIDSTVSSVSKVNGVTAFPNNDIAVTGYSHFGSFSDGKALVQRFDVAGNKLWSTDIDSANVYDEGNDVTVNSSGQVAVTGSTGTATFVAQLDGASGNVLWRSVYNPTNSISEYGVKVRFSPANNVVIISRGWTGFVARYFTAQFNGTTGAEMWSNTYSSQASDREPLELIVESSGRVVTAGWRIQGATTNLDYVLAGYTSSGTLDFSNIYSNPNYTPERLRSITRDADGDFIVTGETALDFLNEYLYQMLTIKYGGTPVGINEIGEQSGISVFPNPSSTGKFFFVDDQEKNPIDKIKIYDVSGRMVRQYSNSGGQNEIDISEFSSGLFLLQFERQDHSVGSMKLIKY